MGLSHQQATATFSSLFFFFFFFYLFMLVIASGLTSSSSSSRQLEWRSGTATYSKDTAASILTGGACGYGDVIESGFGKMSTGVSGALFDKGKACGACYEVRCVDDIRWCLLGSPSIVVTVTDFCAPNYGLPSDFGGWCNFPRDHFDMSLFSFSSIARIKADIVPVQFRRVKCGRSGGVRFRVTGSSYFFQVLISNVGLDGELVAVKVKGSRTAWITMARNWGQNWQCNAELRGQPLSFELTISSGSTLTSFSVAPSHWQYGQSFEGNQFEEDY